MYVMTGGEVARILPRKYRSIVFSNFVETSTYPLKNNQAYGFALRLM